jgi:GntR family transcriptional regulator
LNILAGKIQVDFRAQEPLYLQIARQVQQLTVEGGLKPGDQLPTVRELATELRINFNTVSRAYRVLDETGIISTQRGRGTYIWEMPSPDAAQKLRLEELDYLTQQYVDEATRLGFSPSDIQASISANLIPNRREAKSHQAIEDSIP